MSYVNKKITYRVFCSHSADYPEGDLDAIKAVISTLNNEESSANFEFRDMYTGQSDDNKTAASLIKEANRSDIFFRLIHEEYKKGSINEYKAYKAAKKKRMKVFTFARVDTDKAKALSDSLKAESGSGTIKEYIDIYDKGGQNGEKGLKTLVAGELGTYRDENRGRSRGWYFGIIICILLAILFVLFWKQCSSSNPEDPLAPTITQIDSTRKIISERVSVAEAMVKQGMFDAAKDTLEAIKKDCHPEWEDVLLKINTLESLIPAQPIPYGTPGAIGGQHETESKPVYLHDGFVLTGLSGDFENYVLTQIETTSELRRAPGKKVQWGISITERKNQRGLDDGDYFVDLSVSVSIINNKTGLSLPQLPLYKNECIGSPISYEDAFNAAASEEFAKRIAIGIVNAIKNEN